MDIDNFKRINDSLGHGEGDEVLKVVSQRIKKSIESEGGLLARIGGDEFAIIIEDFDTIDEIGSIARKLKAIMRKTIEIDNYRLRITLSIGISLFPEHGSDIKQLQKAADIALYQSKKNGKNGFAFYAHDDGELLAKIELENDLYKALERDEFELYLQPQVTLESGKAGSMEALIRWRHPSRGILLPGEFLELAGESGLLYRLDLIILEKVMKLLTSWKEKGYRLPVVSVNISNTLFHHSHFLKTMRRHKKIYEDICDSIELELTENIIMESGGGSVSLIHELGVLGYRLSIDDFGTGYSSLSHLKSLNVNKLKIDRTFIHDIVSHKNGQVIVKAIIAMGKTLGLEIVAEGVETEEELNILREFGCDSIQGFYYTRPVTADEIEKRWLSPQ
jgi:diguanylate cyclase (GGDEF)-like protein